MTDRLDNFKGKNVKGFKKWLILSHGFNMDGRAASLTVTDKIPCLLREGIRLHVLSAITGSKDTRFPHQQLIAWGPAAFRFDFRHWFANRFGRNIAYKIITTLVSVILAPFILIEKLLFGYSSQWSWAFPAYFKGLKLINEGKVNLVYSSGGAWSAHLAGLLLKKKTKLPWIVEIHDPLVIRNNEEDIGKDSPKKTEDRKRYWLEKKICQYADIVWWFTDNALYYAGQRNPNLGKTGYAKGLMIIPGANPPNIEPVTQNTSKYFGEYLNICHFGSLANNRSMSQVLEVLPDFFKQYPEAIEKLRLHVYGGQLDPKSKQWIQNSKYKANLIEHGRVENDLISGLTGRQQIEKRMREADVLLLLHGDTEWCREYIPSKLYDYLWTKRPIWGLIYKNEMLWNLLAERNHFISNSNDQKTILKKLVDIWINWNNKVKTEIIYDPIKTDSAVRKILKEVEKL